MTQQVVKALHAKYFRRILQMLPSNCASMDSTRLTIAYFAISGLDILDSLNEFSDEEKNSAIDWIYKLQISNAGEKSGFLASTTLPIDACDYINGHLAMTYTGLAALLILGDDLSRVNRKSLVDGIGACQNSDGSFSGMITGCESDMRFLYCACCVSHILDDWTGINVQKAVDYILRSISYDGAIGQAPGLESHGGSTFCAIASLFLMDKLDILSDKQLNRLRRWCIMRQDGGFHGRPGKPSDTCYSFWIGATLQMLNVSHLSNSDENRNFVLSTQDTVVGGFAKFQYVFADPLHTYLGLSGLSLLGEPSLCPMYAALNVSRRAYVHLQEIHKKWRNT
ncbi:geranylgeranyl transferase type-1 subunit beta [Leptopilina boulardi]|uniref:geranylgeranyl transferase type-1 subunit beta n=1 Tax=Leptopilina boulardi TaxID=63433 RepID=UPI0021F645A6|nr:geranylgeranyl transferase type-1 subunit beta [Leptopilina boulardi]